MPSTPAFKIAVGPAVATSTTLRTVDHFTISNEGSQPITVHGSLQSLARVNGHCAATAASYSARFTPSTMTLAPGQSRHVRAVVTLPSSAHGKIQLYLVETARIVGKDHVAVSASDGSLLQVTLPGATARTATCVAVSAPQHHAASGVPLDTIGAGLGALAVATAALVAILRHRRKPRRSPTHALTAIDRYAR